MCRSCTKPGANHSRSLRPRLPAAQGRTGTMTGRAIQNREKGSRSEVSVPLCESALQHWLPVCFLNGPRPRFSCWSPPAGKPERAYVHFAEIAYGLPYAASPTISASALDPFGEQPAPLPHERRDTYFKETYHDNLSPRQKGTVSPVPLRLCQP